MKNIVTINLLKNLLILSLEEKGYITYENNGFIYAEIDEEGVDNLIIYPVCRKLSQGETTMIKASEKIVAGLRNEVDKYEKYEPCIAYCLAKYNYDDLQVDVFPLEVIEKFSRKGGVFAITNGKYYFDYLKMPKDTLSVSKVHSVWQNTEKDKFMKEYICPKDYTKACLEFWEENKNVFGKVKEMYFFLYEYDAFLNDCYVIDKTNKPRAYRCKIISKDNKVMYLDGLTCGYSGEGVRGTDTLLKSIGIDDKMIDVIYRNKCVKFTNVNYDWNVNCFPSIYDVVASNNLTLNFGKNNGYSVVQISKFRENEKCDYIPFLNEIKKYYFKDVYKVVIASRDKCYKNNMVGKKWFNCRCDYLDVYYSLKMIDRNGKELWINIYYDETQKLEKQKDITNILSIFEFDLEQEDKVIGLVNTIKEKFGKKIYDEIILEKE